jgi:hypothetical protein
MQRAGGDVANCASFNLFDAVGFENCVFEIVEQLPEDCTKEQLLWRERWRIENCPCVNTYIPIRTADEYAEYHRNYREEHRDEKQEYAREYYATHKEKCSEKNRQYRDTHREKVSENNRQYRDTHREELSEYQRRYYEEHKEAKKERRRQNYARKKAKIANDA